MQAGSGRAQLPDGSDARQDKFQAQQTGFSPQEHREEQRQRVQQHTSPAPHLDCLGCRLTGMAFGVAGGGYVMMQLLREPPPTGSHKAAILLTAGAMFAFGMYRALF
jgi:hypothetical protein